MRARERAQAEPEEKPEGFLSFSRLSTLDDMSVDLSAQLRPRKTDEASQQQASASTSASAKATGSQVFTRKESSKLQRVTKASERGATISTAPQPKETEEERMRKAAEEKAKYEQLKLEFQVSAHFNILHIIVSFLELGP